MSDDLMVDSSAPLGAVGGPLRSPRLTRRRLARALGGAAVGCGLFALYFCQSRTAPFNSDGAGNMLQAQAMISGNPLLRGWWSSDVSFYTTELPEYALVTALRGLVPDVVHICGALSYTLTVLLAALVARGRARGAAGWYRAGIAAGITLALCVTGSIGLYLENPNHAGTAVPVLLFLLVLDQAEDRPATRRPAAERLAVQGAVVQRLAGQDPAPRHRRTPWPVPIAVCAVLTLAVTGDKLSLAAAVGPLAVVSAIRLLTGLPFTVRLRARRPEPGSGGDVRRVRPVHAPLDRSLLDGALLAAAVASAGLAEGVNRAIRGLGGFDLRPVNGVLPVPLSQVPAQAKLLWQAVVVSFGANQPGPPHQPVMASAHGWLVLIAAFHVIGLLLALIGLAAGIAALRSARADRVTQVTVVAIGVIVAFGVGTTLVQSPSYFHEVTILMPLAAALAGRVLPPLTARWLPTRLRSASLPVRTLPLRRPGLGTTRRGSFAFAARPRAVSAAALSLGVWLALSLAGAGYAATWPSAPNKQQAVAAWLVSQHQRAGLSGYWQATSTTVTSGGRVVVAAVVLPAAVSAPGRPFAYRWESAADWYQPDRHEATFVIALADPTAPGGGLPVWAVRDTFGPPAVQHQIGNQVIMLYRYNLLTRLDPAAFPG